MFKLIIFVLSFVVKDGFPNTNIEQISPTLEQKSITSNKNIINLSSGIVA